MDLTAEDFDDADFAISLDAAADSGSRSSDECVASLGYDFVHFVVTDF